MLSGYLFHERAFSDLFKNKFHSLIIPYLIVSLFLFLIYAASHPSAWSDQLLGIVIADRPDHLKFNGPLWYLPSLFSVFMIYGMAAYLSNRVWLRQIVLVVSSLIVVFSGLMDYHGSIPFGIDTAIVALPFFCLGGYLKDNYHKERLLWSSILSGVAWIMVVALSGNPYYAIAYGTIKPYPTFYLASIFGSLALFFFSCWIGIRNFPGKNALHKIGGLSFGIYLFHKPFIDLLKPAFKGIPLRWVILTATSMGLSAVIVLVLMRIPKTSRVVLANRRPT